MQLTNKPERFIDDSSNAVTRIIPENSRYDLIEIKQRPDSVEMRVREAGTGRVDNYQFEFTGKSYRGVKTADSRARRNIDDDVQDALHACGFTTIDDSVERW